jgi:isopenicillin-N epimerase
MPRSRQRVHGPKRCTLPRPDGPPSRPTRAHWTLDPEITYLNHGSYGACPRPVLAAQQALRDQLEREPRALLQPRGAALLLAR